MVKEVLALALLSLLFASLKVGASYNFFNKNMSSKARLVLRQQNSQTLIKFIVTQPDGSETFELFQSHRESITKTL